MPELSEKEFKHAGTTWIATRESGVWAGHHSPGVQLPMPPLAGVRFKSAQGEVRFVHLEPPELPSEDGFARLSDRQLIVLFEKARPQPSA